LKETYPNIGKISEYKSIELPDNIFEIKNYKSTVIERFDLDKDSLKDDIKWIISAFVSENKDSGKVYKLAERTFRDSNPMRKLLPDQFVDIFEGTLKHMYKTVNPGSFMFKTTFEGAFGFDMEKMNWVDKEKHDEAKRKYAEKLE
jgi:hypothetical protein